MIRQLGPCTWFITLSAADLKWPDLIQVIAKQQGKQLTDEDVLALSWEEKSRYLRSDPVTAARHFDTRIQLFFKYILMNKQLNPLGDIVDYKYRIEYQLRLRSCLFCEADQRFETSKRRPKRPSHMLP